MLENHILPSCGIHHIALRASDLERSIRFYTQALGFQVIARWQEGAESIAMLDTGNGTILEIFHGGAPGDHTWDKTAGAMFHLAFSVSDVDNAFYRAIQYGATSKIPPQDVDLPALPQELKVHNAFVYGPDGEVLEFFRLRNNASASDRITEEMNS